MNMKRSEITTSDLSQAQRSKRLGQVARTKHAVSPPQRRSQPGKNSPLHSFEIGYDQNQLPSRLKQAEMLSHHGCGIVKMLDEA